MNFRKTEVERMRLRALENELISFINDIFRSYKSIAHMCNIDLRLHTHERSLPLWFDVNMLDKVLFNLLYNALDSRVTVFFFK